MKVLIFFILSFVSSSLMGQKAYNWINFPTLDGINHIEESRVREALLVEGSVKEIKMTSFFTGDDERDFVHIVYSELGRVNSIRDTHEDPTPENGINCTLFIEFEYDETGKLMNEPLLMVIEGDTIEQSEKRWPDWFPFLPAPIETYFGRSMTQLADFYNTTYSFYDEYNRKIMDSIPSFGDDDGMKITYRYEGNKIHRAFYDFNDPEGPNRKEEYTVDEHGNWIELKYFDIFAIDADYVTQLYTREIVYN